jgi:hypothetical protein
MEQYVLIVLKKHYNKYERNCNEEYGDGGMSLFDIISKYVWRINIIIYLIIRNSIITMKVNNKNNGI